MSDVPRFLWGLLGAILIAVIFVVFLQTIVNAGLAPQPGDAFFPAWLDVTRYGWKALLLIIPGAGAAAYFVIKMVFDGGGY